MEQQISLFDQGVWLANNKKAAPEGSFSDSVFRCYEALSDWLLSIFERA